MQNAHIATIIKSWCNSNGVSISSLLADCNLSKSFIYDLEKRAASPSCDKLARIADYLDCSIDYLLGRTAPAPARSANSILTPADQELVELYHRASGDDRTIVDAALRKYKIPSRAEQVG